MLGPIAYWHILQSLTFMIIRTHWDSPDKGCKYACNLQNDITNWNLGGISRENAKYHIVEPLLKQSWTARILAMFYEVIVGEDYLNGALKRRHIDQNLPKPMHIIVHSPSRPVPTQALYVKIRNRTSSTIPARGTCAQALHHRSGPGSGRYGVFSRHH